MRDPELISRAQRAAARLEWAWERWRTRHGLGGPFAQPVASYVGYSPEEPRGRPRVVFGVDAVEAEQLAVLLDGDTRGVVTDLRACLPGQRDDSPGPEAAAHATAGASASASAGAGAAVAAPGPDTRGAAAGPAYGPPASAVDGATPDAAAEAATGPAALSAGALGPAGRSAPASLAGHVGSAIPGASAHSMAAELAGWATSELPGHASAGLAAWTAAERESRTQPGDPGDDADAEREDRARPLPWPV